MQVPFNQDPTNAWLRALHQEKADATACGPRTTTHTHADVAFAETQLRRNIQEDAAWRPDGAVKPVRGTHTRRSDFPRTASRPRRSLVGGRTLIASLCVGRCSHPNDPETDCSLCGQVLDLFCDHATVCPCAGDRNRRHNVVTHVFHEVGQEASVVRRRRLVCSSPPRL